MSTGPHLLQRNIVTASLAPQLWQMVVVMLWRRKIVAALVAQVVMFGVDGESFGPLQKLLGQQMGLVAVSGRVNAIAPTQSPR